jgi:hypothetical protein
VLAFGCACRKSNSHIQMMKSAKKWRRQNATNGMYGSRRRRRLPNCRIGRADGRSFPKRYFISLKRFAKEN